MQEKKWDCYDTDVFYPAQQSSEPYAKAQLCLLKQSVFVCYISSRHLYV